MTTRSFRIFAVALALGVLAVLLPANSPVVAQGANEFTVSGKGWGHGVGMSQHGAYGRAAAGQSYQQILGFYYPGTALQTQSMPNDLRVLLATTSSTTVTMSGIGAVWVDGTKLKQTAANTSVVVTRNGSNFQITANGSSLCPSGGCAGTQVHVDPKNGTLASLSATGRSYSWGRITFTRSSSSMYVVLDRLPMERYLYGLGEMPSSWPAEALKTQAVAARSYALEAVLRRRAASSWTRPWDLYASTQDQAFVGASQEVSAWTSQVNATAGVVATYGGNPIQAFYSSSHGGHSELSSYVFTASLPYLPAQPDPYDDHNNQFHTWTRTYTTEQLSKWLNAYGDTSVGTLQSVSISGNIGASGRTNKATVTLTGTSGTKTVNGNRFMVVVNVGTGNDGLGLSSQVMSTLFTVSGSGGGGGGDDDSGSDDDGGGPVDPSPPTGYLDAVTAEGDGVVRVQGWAADASNPDTSVNVHFYVNGAYAGGANAKKPRPDVGDHTGLGDYHGFNAFLDVGAGSHELCAYAINIGPSAPNILLGCRTVSASGATPSPAPSPADEAPIGYFDQVVDVGPGVVRIDGWAADATDASVSVNVHYYANGTYVGGSNANRLRIDVGDYTGLGNYHGWSARLELGSGSYEICAYAINFGPAAPNSLLGCIDATL